MYSRSMATKVIRRDEAQDQDGACPDEQLGRRGYVRV